MSEEKEEGISRKSLQFMDIVIRTRIRNFIKINLLISMRHIRNEIRYREHEMIKERRSIACFILIFLISPLTEYWSCAVIEIHDIFFKFVDRDLAIELNQILAGAGLYRLLLKSGISGNPLSG